jgi:hypothetical protein
MNVGSFNLQSQEVDKFQSFGVLEGFNEYISSQKKTDNQISVRIILGAEYQTSVWITRLWIPR